MNCTFWPDPGAAGACNSVGDSADNPGPGHAFEPMPSSFGPDDGKALPDTTDFKADPNLKLPDDYGLHKVAYSNAGDAMLYVNKDSTRWYLQVKIKVTAPTPHVEHSDLKWVFAQSADQGRPAFPQNLPATNVMGLTAQSDTIQLRYSGSPDNKRGLWYAVGNVAVTRNSNPQDLSANCVGPVIWWGMDIGEKGKGKSGTAWNACENDGL
jgi:hypothetical protein